jgi:hypothetical protein
MTTAQKAAVAEIGNWTANDETRTQSGAAGSASLRNYGAYVRAIEAAGYNPLSGVRP